MNIASLFKIKDAPPVEGAARTALAANRLEVERLQTQVERLFAKEAEIRAAKAAAEAVVAAPIGFREQLAAAEIAAMAEAELNGTALAVKAIEELRVRLTQSESLAAGAATRVLVEEAKRAKIQGQLDALQVQQRQVQAQHAPLAVEVLWESLEEHATTHNAARAKFVEDLNRTWAVARAIDVMAEAMKSGRFAGAGSARDLVLPTVFGVSDLPYSQATHLTMIEMQAVAILRELGLHA